MRFYNPALEQVTEPTRIKRGNDLSLYFGNIETGFDVHRQVAEFTGDDLDEGEPPRPLQRTEN